MKRFLSKLVLSAAIAATTLAAVPAEAGDRWRHGNRDRPAVAQDDGAALLAAGIIGLAAGAIVAGIVAGSQHDGPDSAESYRHPQPRPQPDRDYFPPPPARPMDYAYGPRRAEPWSREWYRACSARYRSFDPSTGTYVARGGRRFCVIG